MFEGNIDELPDVVKNYTGDINIYDVVFYIKSESGLIINKRPYLYITKEYLEVLVKEIREAVNTLGLDADIEISSKTSRGIMTPLNNYVCSQ
jgi:hypothetical protein